MARSAKRAAPAATAPSSKKKRTTHAPSSRPADSDDSLNELDFSGSDDGFVDLEAGAQDVESEDEFAGGADGAQELAMSEEESEGEESGDEGSELDGVDSGGSDEDMIGDDEEDLHAGLTGAAGGMSEDDGEDSQGEADDDGWETVGTAPSKPLIAPAAELEKKRKGKAPKPLSAAELRALAFAELTASPISNVLSTQVAALLDPVTPPAPASSPLQPLLKALHAHLTNLPKQKPISLAGLKKKGTVVPRVEGGEGKWARMDLPFEKPRSEDVRVIGKWAWSGGLKEKGEYVVELAVAMPPSLLQPKDYLAPRFCVKSTHYLVTLAALLPESLGSISTSFFPLPGSQGYALDIRSATPKGAEKVGLGKVKGAVIRIRVVSPADAFAASKLSPTSNVARPPSLVASAAEENPQFDPSTLPYTPLHTSSLHLSSLNLLTSHLKYHHSLATSYSSYAASARLLQTWATRRGYGASLGLSAEWWAWCVARSLNAGKAAGGDVASLAAGGEAWAGWRKAIEWLATAKWTEGIWFSSTEETYSKGEFKEAFQGKPLFVDPTGTINLAAGIELSTLEMLKHDARETISLLLAGVEDERKFESAFSREVRAVERFDNFARIVVPAVPKVDGDAAVDYADPLAYLTSSISATLQRALGNRVRAFVLTPPAPSAIPCSPSPAKPPSSVCLTLGVLLDPAQSLRLVDQGPSAEDEEACADFRAFWGRKSELRRFKDGAIVESVVWEQPGPGGLGPQRNKIVHHIVRYILDERHGIPAANIDFFAAAMDHLLVEPEAVRRAIYLEDSVATGKGFGNVINAFDELSKELKDLLDLPLSVASIQPCSPSLRYSSVFTPSPRRLKDFEHQPESAKYIAPHDILLTLESSGRWPDDLEGIQKIKAAFLSKIGEGLEATRSVLRAELAFDVEARTVDDNVSLEILTASGWAFRARIFYDRSQLLLEEREEQLGAAASSSTSLSSLDTWTQRFVHAPKHHAAIANLQHHFTSYSHTVRLLKRWVSAHMLSSSFSDELLELVVASVLLDPSSPYDPPNSGATGFARVMDRISRWNWRDEPLFVPIYSFSNAITSGRRAVLPTADKADAIASFQAMRLAKPAMDEHAWVVATEDDVEGTLWSKATGKVAAARIRGLAKAALKTLEEGVMSGGLVVEQLFSPPLGDYAFLIHLDPSVVPRHFQSLSPEPRALASRARSSILSGSLMGQAAEDDAIRIGFDPVADFVKHLERLYPSVFLLFYSADGAPVIGGIWNPSVEGAKAFKVGLGYPSAPAETGDGKAKVTLDKRAVLRDIERLGKGLVSRVEEVKR
ncbi:hypothetical protein JCM10213_008290 [Rhodosporidiobolus nylandii]